MKERDPAKRKKDFGEVPLGYTEEEAVREASRCLQCELAPCVKGCPAEVNIPAFIKAVKERKFEEAAGIIKKTNELGAMCGRVCPQEDQCEARCVLLNTGKPINIGALERFVSDWRREHEKQRGRAGGGVRKNKKVAVIGSGPAGLVCASDLAKMGYEVTVFEALHEPGGVLTYGIPEFRLPKDIIQNEIEQIKRLGVDIKCNYIIGRIKTVEDLRADGYEAFFIGTGAGLPRFMGIPGENLNGVYSANEFLTRVNLMKAYRFPEYDTPVNVGGTVAVVGAGNVAMDSARSALRLGAENVHIVYRRSEKEMPARREEVRHAKEEGVEFRLLTTPVEIKGDKEGNVKEMVCVRNRLGEPDAGGRRRPVAIKGSEFGIKADTVIIAIGNLPNPVLVSTIKELDIGDRGNIKVDEETCRTNVEDIFAGGDIVTGSATVIAAMGAGKRAARSIDGYLSEKK